MSDSSLRELERNALETQNFSELERAYERAGKRLVIILTFTGLKVSIIAPQVLHFFLRDPKVLIKDERLNKAGGLGKLKGGVDVIKVSSLDEIFNSVKDAPLQTITSIAQPDGIKYIFVLKKSFEFFGIPLELLDFPEESPR